MLRPVMAATICETARREKLSIVCIRFKFNLGHMFLAWPHFQIEAQSIIIRLCLASQARLYLSSLEYFMCPGTHIRLF